MNRETDLVPDRPDDVRSESEAVSGRRDSDRPARDAQRFRSWRMYGVVALTILAPAMGGSTELWAQAILAIGAGLLMLFLPPRRSLGLIPNILFAGIFLIALSAFLPAQWFAVPDWKADMLRLGASFPMTRSPQPWLSLQWSCFLLLALAWAYYLATFRWQWRQRENASIAFAIAILVLSAGLTIAFITKIRIPFWPAVQEFGFFPNRNQTSNVLGLGAVLIYALGLQRYQEGRKHWAWMLFASLSLVCWALIIDESRAGIVLFFLGALAVHIYWWLTSRDRRQPLVAFGGLALLIALFIVDGGATLARFGKQTTGSLFTLENLRLSIYRDAIPLIAKSSPLGVGLGNFWPIFAVNRHYSANISQTAHPESDWLWGAIDLGWLGILVALGLFYWWLRQCPPFSPGTNRLLRMAAMICGIAFAIHGLLDVSGHRLGALWPALFFSSIATFPKTERRLSSGVPIIFRIIGVILLAVGGWWLASFSMQTLPNTLALQRLKAQTERELASENYREALDDSSAGLKIVPLDWNLYFQRGLAEAALFASRSEILRDFALARYLLPNWPDLYLKEGAVWVNLGEPELAFDVWEEGMRQMPEQAPYLYADLFGAIRSDPELREKWRQLGQNDRRCLLVFLGAADKSEFQIELQDLLSKDPHLQTLTVEDLKKLFSIWYEKGDKLWLAQVLKENPAWRSIGWRQLAKSFADYGDYRQAFETASEFLPTVPPPADPEEARAQFGRDPADGKAGASVALAEANEGKINDALSILATVARLPRAPKDLPAIEGRLWAKKQDWKRAWTAISPLVLAQ